MAFRTLASLAAFVTVSQAIIIPFTTRSSPPTLRRRLLMGVTDTTNPFKFTESLDTAFDAPAYVAYVTVNGESLPVRPSSLPVKEH